MVYKCINCGNEWGEGTPETEGFSHGLCTKCVKDRLSVKYHKEQLNFSGFACFGTADNYCDQYNCKYSELCLEK